MLLGKGSVAVSSLMALRTAALDGQLLYMLYVTHTTAFVACSFVSVIVSDFTLVVCFGLLSFALSRTVAWHACCLGSLGFNCLPSGEFVLSSAERCREVVPS